ncbi:hypothetical protein K492DRAFT_229475 [Lichtheimia hyalospora FSU 10163]|nr:hypothetical protein K492DRAFT_229475 [Lichtheimia hyalospora FSU 10163]
MTPERSQPYACTRIATDEPVIAKISLSSLRLEREFYLMKKLYQYVDGSRFIVRPMEYLRLSNGMVAAIYYNDDRSASTHNERSYFPYPYTDFVSFLQLAIQCTDCVEFIHRHQIVHGQVRLSAFRQSRDGKNNIKIWDVMGQSSNKELLLKSGGWRKAVNNDDIVLYMSPEQTGRTTYACDHRSDIYSLGIMFFVLLTGKHPFDVGGGVLDILNGILSRKPVLAHELMPNIPEMLSRIIEKMIHKVPDDRYASAHGVRYDLIECFKRLNIANHQKPAITPFPLAQHDIASLFTLPKTVYGRQAVLEKMRTIIAHCATSYNPASSFPSKLSDIIDSTSEDMSISESNSGTKSDGDSRSVYSGVDINSEHIISSTGSDKHSRGWRKTMRTTLVGLYGPGGIGKSTLFTSVQPMARQNGYVATVKFDSRNKVPYSALLQALSQILQQIMTEPQEEMRRFHHYLRACLGARFSNIGILAGFVPELGALLERPDSEKAASKDATAIQTDNIEAQTRFLNMYVEIFRSITYWRMITLFLDDLHQADDASLGLLEALAASKVNVLLFMSYRDKEVSGKFADFLQNRHGNIHLLQVGALDMEPLIDLCCDALRRSRDNNNDREYIRPFAQIIYDKARGNAFYTTQLLQIFVRRHLVFFNWETNAWDYDFQQIQQADICGHAMKEMDVAFITARLRELPESSQKLLKLASFIGDTFSWSTVRNLMLHSTDDNETAASYEEQQDNEPMSSLQNVIQEGYIVPIDEDKFKWSHDRISQAASELVDPNAKGSIHFIVARHLMREHQSDLFLIADHLLKCKHILLSLHNKQPYRKVLIQAGNMGQSTGAHSMAINYYNMAIRLCSGDEEWMTDYDTMLSLYTNAAALSWIVGKHDRTESLLNTVFTHAITAVDRIAAYHIQAKFYFGRQLYSKSRAALLQCLVELGDELSKMDVSDQGLEREYNQIEQLLEEKTMDDILDMPPCQDPLLIGSMGLMDELLAILYWNGDHREMYYWAARILVLSLTKGSVSHSGAACMLVCSGFTTLYGKYDIVEKLGSLGIALTEKNGRNQDKGRAYNLYAAFVLFWKQHYRETFQWFRLGIQYSMAAGDVIYGSMNQIHICTQMFFQGHHLTDTLRQAEATYDSIHAWWPSFDTNSFAICIIRVCKALSGQTYIDTPDVFDGDDGFNDTQFIKENIYRQSSNPESILNWYEAFKMVPLVLYEHTDAAIQVGRRSFATIDGHPCHRHTRMMLFYYSLALLQKARQVEMDDEKEALLAQVKRNQELIKPWAVACPVNFGMYWTTIEAELMQFENGSAENMFKVCRLYETAMSQAREGSWLLEMCVIHECAGAFYHRIDMPNVAVTMIKKSIDLYTSHGSYGKARQVGSKYASLLASYLDDNRELHDASIQTEHVALFNGGNSWSSSQESNQSLFGQPLTVSTGSTESIPPVTSEQTLMTLDIIDMASILKSCQVMSSEVKSEGLLTAMMNIILENSGADCGAILLKNEYYGVCAYGTGNRGGKQDDLNDANGVQYFDPPKRLSESETFVPSPIVHHMLRTKESLFIQDVAQDPRFASGPWFERLSRRTSVICMPIMHRSMMIGCLFVEGAAGIFTRRHNTVLGLLCQQMGISISNANLFTSVQRATAATMNMIEKQTKALQEAKRSKEAADRATRLREIFLANMSHEIRTPFSGFYGMISLLAGTKLDKEQKDLVHTAKTSCSFLLQIIDDLLNYSKLQAGKVTLDLSPVVIEDLVADVIEMLIVMALQKRINITYTVADDVPSVVMADGNRLRQIVINLLGNAIKFTHKGEISIRCSLAKNNDNTGNIVENENKDGSVMLLFEVEDTGIGISEEQRKMLFVPFSQVDGSTTRKYGGTGLGLSICSQLVDLMNGSIDVKSTFGKGSTFYFTACATPLREEITKRNNAIAVRLANLNNMRILVADNHASTVAMVRHMLPGIQIDGVQQLMISDANAISDYNFVLMGLFFDEQHQQHLQLNKARYIVRLHYPKNNNGETTLSESKHHDDRQQLLKSANEDISISMTIPLRRRKLLRIISEIIQRQQPGICTSPLPWPEYRPPTRPAGNLTEQERVAFKDMHILAAEDNPVAQKLLYKQLTRLGFQVQMTNNGLEAVEVWLSRPVGYFKIGFFDHHMPLCDGVEATRRIRKLEQNRNDGRVTAEHSATTAVSFPIVALTADIQDSAKHLCMEAGMNDYLTKPFDTKELIDILRKHCT